MGRRAPPPLGRLDPQRPAAFATDAASSIVGPLLGTSVVTAYIESVTGVQALGRGSRIAGIVWGLGAVFVVTARLI